MEPISCKRHRFLPDTIRLAVWLYFCFTMSLRDVEEMLAQRFVSTHSAIYDTFNIERHLISRNTMRHFRSAAMAEWLALSAAAP